jgi:hypothetical protein
MQEVCIEQVGSGHWRNNYETNIEGIVGITWDRYGTEPASEYAFFYGKRNENYDFGTSFFVFFVLCTSTASFHPHFRSLFSEQKCFHACATVYKLYAWKPTLPSSLLSQATSYFLSFLSLSVPSSVSLFN